MAAIKILIADDSVLMRMLVSDLFKDTHDIDVVGTAKDGKDAVALVKQLKPDVLLLDLVMPEYDGIFALQQLQTEHPLPTIILSATMQSEQFDTIVRAMELGAFDYVSKPSRSGTGMISARETIISKIRAAAKFDASKMVADGGRLNTNPHVFLPVLPYDAVVVGSSTGGPTALEKFITHLPSNLPVPVIIAQHIPDSFVPSLARRLNALSPLPVVVAKSGDPVLGGRIYILPGLVNTVLERKNKGLVVFNIDAEVYRQFNAPSVDALFLSAADTYKKRCIALQLTGMGRDGLMGLKRLREHGAHIVAQSKESCVVYGMPKAAVDEGLQNAVVHITQMGGYVVSSLS